MRSNGSVTDPSGVGPVLVAVAAAAEDDRSTSAMVRSVRSVRPYGLRESELAAHDDYTSMRCSQACLTELSSALGLGEKMTER